MDIISIFTGLLKGLKCIKNISYSALLFNACWLYVCCCLIAKFCPTVCGCMDCSLPGSSVRGISQARISGWVAISFSRWSFWPRDRIHISCIGRQILYPRPPRKPCWWYISYHYSRKSSHPPHSCKETINSYWKAIISLYRDCRKSQKRWKQATFAISTRLIEMCSLYILKFTPEYRRNWKEEKGMSFFLWSIWGLSSPTFPKNCPWKNSYFMRCS